MISTYNILGKMENPLCVTVQRSAGFFYFATVKLGKQRQGDRGNTAGRLKTENKRDIMDRIL
jgi:hypothetical protein